MSLVMNFFKKLSLSFLFFIALSAHAGLDNDLYKIKLPNPDNEQVSLAQYKDKVILLNFWATWCPPCIKEMPSMQRLRDHFEGQPFEIIAINTGDDSTSVSSFLFELETELTFPILLDEQGQSYQQFGIRGLPMTLIFDRNGEMVEKVLGGREWDSAESIKAIQTVIEYN